MVFLTLVLGLFGLDIYVKEKIEEQDPSEFPRDMEGSKGRIKLYQNHNSGFSFGFLKEREELVRMIPLIFTSGLAGIFCWLLPKKGEVLAKTAFSLALAGALSNLYDRLVRRYVVDYFSIQAGALKKVVFNLADLCIMIGAFLIVISEAIDTFRHK